MKREKNYKTAKFIEALEHIDPKYVEEAGKKIKERQTGQTVASMSRAKSLRQVLALVACVLLLSAVIPAVTYLVGHLPDILGSSTGDDTTEQTSPETPPEETTVPAPETTVPETTIEETTAEETTSEPETTECIHSDMITREIVPKCTEIYYIESYCNLCGYTKREPQAPYGHRFVNGICEICGYNIESDGSQGLEYRIIGDHAEVTGIGTCTDTEIVIPSQYKGYPVREIDQWAFKDNTRITSVRISDSVTRIAGNAFAGCTSLNSVYISASVIDVTALSFDGCINITSITVDPANPIYEGTNCIIQKSSKWLLLGCRTTVIPADGSVQYIGDSAFKGILGLYSITVPEGVVDIEIGAFNNCSDLRELHLPSTLRQIGAAECNIIYGCNNIEVITIPKNAEYFYVEGNCLIEKATGALVLGCKASVIPTDGSIKEIGRYAFQGNTNINNIVIPEGVTRIGEAAFAGCRKLQSITLPKSLTEIGPYAFESCTSLRKVSIPENVTVVYYGAFRACTKLTEVVLPKLKELYWDAFGACTSLTEVDYLGTRKDWNSLVSDEAYWCHGSSVGVIHCSDGDVSLIGSDGSQGLEYRIEGDHAVLVGIGTCTDKEIIVASTYNGLPVTAIGRKAIYSLDGITRVVISDTVTHLDYMAIAWCSDLESIHIPANLTTMEECAIIAFGNIRSITVDPNNPNYYSVKNCLINRETKTLILGCDTSIIPTDGSISAIAPKAFMMCAGIESITIPEGVTKIGEDAFYDCSALKSIELPESLITIDSSAFANCSSLQNVKLGGKVEYMGDYVFSECEKLGEIILPDSLSFLGNYAFQGCTDLKRAVLSSNLEILELMIFASCTNLEDVIIPEGVKTISTDAFSNTALKELKLPASIKAIRQGAFEYCDNLMNVSYAGTVTQWIAVEKDIGWHTVGTFKKIRCSDGEMKLYSDSKDEGSLGLEYEINTDGKSARLIGEGICTDAKIVVAAKFHGLPVTEIYSVALSNCDFIEEIVIPEGVTVIRNQAFYRCVNLKKITLPSTLEYIYDSAFADCESLVSIVIPREVKLIETWAFRDCKNLTKFTFAGTVAEWNAIQKGMGNNWNDGCPFTVIHCSDGDVELYDTDGSQGLEYWVSDDGRSASLVGIGTCTDKDIIIASTYNGVPVTEILPSAFLNNGNIRSVRISDSVEVIGYEAFSGCKALESIYIGAGLREIGAEAFVGNSVLSNITVDAKNPYFSGNGYCIVEKSTKTLILGCSHTVIPTDGSVKKIGINAFRDNELFSTITIPVGVTEIESYAFEGCTNLVFVYLPEGLTTVGTDVFKGCTRLQSIDIPESLTVIALSMFEGCSNLRSVSGCEGVTLIEAKAFEGCTKLEAFTFANKLTQIDSLAFKNCSALKSIDIPATVTEIGQEAFSGCTALESVTIRGNVQSLYGGVFAKCSSLKNVNLHGSVGSVSDYAFEYCTSLKKITLPEGTKIGRGAFYECTALESINIPRGGTEIGDEAFSGCTSLAAIVIPEGVEKIELEAFYRCKNLSSVTLPSTLTEIGSWAFAECESLESIVLPDSVVRVSDRAFSDCRSLSSVKFGKGVELIMENAFLYCTSLKSVTLPGSLIELCNGAFAGCSSLEDVIFEKGIDRLGFGVFSDCLKLDEITFTGNIAEWDNVFVPEDAFGNIEIKRINCADGVINNSEPEAPSLEYKLAPDGRSARVVGIGGIADSDIVIDATYLGVPVTEIADNAFFGCSAIKSVIIPESVTKIGAHAFSLCTNLERITLPDSVTSIGEYAFHACENLRTADLGESVVSIGSNAFFACRRLESIYLGGKLQTIGDSAFFECVRLKSLTLPKTLKSIGAMAFSECKSIESVTYKGTAAEWKKITLDEMWTFESSIALVKCSDGDVKK